MTRGKNKLFYNLFNEEEQPDKEAKKRNYQMPLRDSNLAHRYYYHMVILRRRYDDALDELEKEFFISKHRIATVLQNDENYPLVQKIFEDKPDIKALRQVYPQWSWTSQSAV